MFEEKNWHLEQHRKKYHHPTVDETNLISAPNGALATHNLMKFI